MGIYLSQPSTEINTEQGCGNQIAYAVGEMQGWRRNMEDSHIAILDMDSTKNTVRRDHGNVSSIDCVIVSDGKESNYDSAIQERGGGVGSDNNIVLSSGACTAVDNNGDNAGQQDTVAARDESRVTSAAAAKAVPITIAPMSKWSLFGVFDGHGGKEVAKFVKLKFPRLMVEELNQYEHDVVKALRESFFRVDDLLEDEMYADLLQELRLVPNPSDMPPAAVGPRRASGAGSITSNSTGPVVTVSPKSSSSSLLVPASSSDTAAGLTVTNFEVSPSSDLEISNATGSNGSIEGTISRGETVVNDDKTRNQLTTSEAVDMIQSMLDQANANISNSNTSNKHEQETNSGGSRNENKSFTAVDGGGDIGNEMHTMAQVLNETKLLSGNDDGDCSVSHCDSNNQSISNVEDLSRCEEETTATSAEGQLPLPRSRVDRFNVEVDEAHPPAPAAVSGSNGSLSCNLKNHRVVAGCTAVVVVHVDNKLFVANAGDSRAVLCRKTGTSYPLSFDHKPQQPREMKRITNAGGFVNFVGRINGNLNLSRSLGDLKYKQLYHLPREEQVGAYVNCPFIFASVL